VVFRHSEFISEFHLMITQQYDDLNQVEVLVNYTFNFVWDNLSKRSYFYLR